MPKHGRGVYPGPLSVPRSTLTTLWRGRLSLEVSNNVFCQLVLVVEEGLESLKGEGKWALSLSRVHVLYSAYVANQYSAGAGISFVRPFSKGGLKRGL